MWGWLVRLTETMTNPADLGLLVMPHSLALISPCNLQNLADQILEPLALLVKLDKVRLGIMAVAGT